MANGKIRFGKQSGGVLSLTFPDGVTNTEVMLPESGTVTSVDGSVTDNSIARYDGTTGKLQGSGVTIDDNGNVGIGVTPSASYNRALDFGYTKLSNWGGSAALLFNAYTTDYTNGSKYYIDAPAMAYRQIIAGHQWLTAPSGTAGNPITWNNMMTLSSTGELQVNGKVIEGTFVAEYHDLNNLHSHTRKYFIISTSVNIPIAATYGYLEVIVHGAGTYCMQRFTVFSDGRVFVRVLLSGVWSAWVEK